MTLKEAIEQFGQAAVEQHLTLSTAAVITLAIFADKSRDRNNVIDTLVKHGVPFASEWNTVFDMGRRYIDITCPYCAGRMGPSRDGSGNGETTTLKFRCAHCGGAAVLQVPSVGALEFNPPSE